MSKFEADEIVNPRKTMDRRMRDAEGDSPGKPSAPAPKSQMSQAEFSGYDKPRKKSSPPAKMVGYAKGGMVKRSASHPTGKCRMK